MDKIHYYVCQTDKLLAKYVKIAEANSGHILELDKTMKNMRFMTNMNDQYTNKSDNKENGKDDVEDIDPVDTLVNYFNNGNNYNDNDDNDDEEDDDDNDRDLGNANSLHSNANKEGDSLLHAVYLEDIIVGKYFNVQVNIPQLILFVHRTQEQKDRLDDDEEEDLMTYQIMTFWFKCQPKLIHVYSLVGCILSPNP